MTQDQMRRWAAIGAERRLVELAEEAALIYAAFPELRDRSQSPRPNTRAAGTANATELPSDQSAAPSRRPRRRRRLSPEARKRISEAQKARWAKQRKSAAAK